MTVRGAFICRGPLALFLDVDGTLLEIASEPSAVRVPAALRNTIHLAHEREGGALALISGRRIEDLDRLFHPYAFPAAGQHGVERRDARGRLEVPAVDGRLLEPARARLAALLQLDKGLLLEDKGSGLAVHYRRAPRLAEIVRDQMEQIAETLRGDFVLRMGKCVVELSPAGYSKRTAIEAFMREDPFRGRTPVFIGDDVTDEDGFQAINRLGGYSIRVGRATETAARYAFANVSAVIGWLRERNVSLPKFDRVNRAR